MNDASKNPDIERVRSVAEHSAEAVPDTPDEQTKKGERVHAEAQKKAKTAALRAEEAEREHVAALNQRIRVLQDKLNLREEELHHLLPRNAELEQAHRNAVLNSRLSLVAVASGGGLTSLSSIFPKPFSYLAGAFGAALLIAGLVLSSTTCRSGWPPGKR